MSVCGGNRDSQFPRTADKSEVSDVLPNDQDQDGAEYICVTCPVVSQYHRMCATVVSINASC